MKRHPLDPLSVVFGTLFAGLGLLFLVSNVSWSEWHATWVWPVGIIALGAALVALAPHGRADRQPDGELEDPDVSP
ncbi:MAG: hypothetical protein ABR579_07485 [Actinomycetota bacterium]